MKIAPLPKKPKKRQYQCGIPVKAECEENYDNSFCYTYMVTMDSWSFCCNIHPVIRGYWSNHPMESQKWTILMISFWLIIAIIFAMIIGTGVYFGIQLARMHSRSDEQKAEDFIKKLSRQYHDDHYRG